MVKKTFLQILSDTGDLEKQRGEMATVTTPHPIENLLGEIPEYQSRTEFTPEEIGLLVEISNLLTELKKLDNPGLKQILNNLSFPGAHVLTERDYLQGFIRNVHKDFIAFLDKEPSTIGNIPIKIVVQFIWLLERFLGAPFTDISRLLFLFRRGDSVDRILEQEN